jgi:diguanylate cyclase (GGDEF)-like protein/PAS domain S-box-containing protein
MDPQLPAPRPGARPAEDASAWFERALLHSAQPFLLCDARGRIVATSSDALLVLARRPRELHGVPLDRFVHPDDVAHVGQLIARALRAQDEHALGRVRCFAPDGDEIPTEMTVRPLPPHVRRDGPAAVTVELRDLRPQLTRALAEAQALSHAVLNSASDGILVVTRAGVITRANPAAERILGASTGGLIGASVHQFVPEQVRGRHAQLIADFSAVGPHVMGAHRQLTGVRADGRVVPLEVTLTEVTEYGKDHVCAVIRDVTDRVEFETRLMDQARTDALTGLPNRVVLAERLDQVVARLDRHDGLLAVLIVDVDNFKAINDVYGHATGDNALIQIAERLKTVVRTSDTLARLGGDEFAVVAEEIDDHDPTGGMLALAERIRAVMAEPIIRDAHALHATLSVGACLARGGGNNPETLLANADLALYEAKRQGRNSVVGFDPGMRQQATRVQTLREQLHDALSRQELVPHYQPLFDLATSEAVGVESLVRWSHPSEGLLLPGAFLPAAMLDDLVVEIDIAMMETAVATVAAAEDRMQVWVNVSGRTLGSGRLATAVRGVLARTGLEPWRLTVEISESALPTDSPSVLSALHEVADVGVRLAIDDFGTGYCSVAHLSRLPLHAVKLDRSLLANDEASAIVPGLVAILRALQLVPVVEGIEDAGHLERARSAGASVGQGYGLARPMPWDEVQQWLGPRLL